MGLIAVATVVVELLMLNVMPLRERYKAAKFESTEDFTSLHKDVNIIGKIKNKLKKQADTADKPEQKEQTHLASVAVGDTQVGVGLTSDRTPLLQKQQAQSHGVQ